MQVIRTVALRRTSPSEGVSKGSSLIALEDASVIQPTPPISTSDRPPRLHPPHSPLLPATTRLAMSLTQRFQYLLIESAENSEAKMLMDNSRGLLSLFPGCGTKRMGCDLPRVNLEDAIIQCQVSSNR